MCFSFISVNKTNKTKIITKLVYVHTATNPTPEPEEDTFPIVSGNFQLNQEEV